MASDATMRDTWEKKTTRAYKHSFPAWMERLGIIRGSVAAGLSRAFGTSSQRVRSDAFRQIYSPRAPTAAQSRA